MVKSNYSEPVSSRVDKDTFDEMSDIIYDADDMKNVSDFIRVAIDHYLHGDNHTVDKKASILGRIGIKR